MCTMAVFLNPSNSAAWKSLADTSDEPFPANMALGLAQSKTMPDLNDLCEALEASGTVDHDQMSLVIAPWREEGWKRLAQDVGA